MSRLKPVSAPTYRHLDQLVVFAAGVSPDEVDAHITGDPVAGTALSWPLGPVHQHLGRVAEFVQLVVVQPGAGSNICGNMWGGQIEKKKKKKVQTLYTALKTNGHILLAHFYIIFV